MRTLRTLSVVCLVIALTVPSGAAAQSRHVVDPSVLSDTIAAQLAREDADRATVHELLNRPEVRDAAAGAGIDVDRVNASVDTLSGTALSNAASAAQQVGQELVGGASSVTISTTTIIIGLLILIVILVAAD